MRVRPPFATRLVLPVAALELLVQVAFANSYGTTEVIAIFGEHPDGLPRPGISVGYPLPFVEVRRSSPLQWARLPGLGR